MKDHFFENKKLKSILTTWLDQEYLETSNFPLLKDSSINAPTNDLYESLIYSLNPIILEAVSKFIPPISNHLFELSFNKGVNNQQTI